MAQQPMPISSRWFQGAVLTYLIGFTVLGVLAYLVYRDQPPMPATVVEGDKVLFTRDDILGGMNVSSATGSWNTGPCTATALISALILPPSTCTRAPSF
jgi:nitric oxide reductase large subunit